MIHAKNSLFPSSTMIATLAKEFRCAHYRKIFASSRGHHLVIFFLLSVLARQASNERKCNSDSDCQSGRCSNRFFASSHIYNFNVYYDEPPASNDLNAYVSNRKNCGHYGSVNQYNATCTKNPQCSCNSSDAGSWKNRTFWDGSDRFTCFSPHTVAYVKGKGKVPMSMVRVGDKVLTSSGKYENIFAMDHHHLSKPTEFLQIFYNDRIEPLELTPMHMLFKAGDATPVPANKIKIGDHIKTLNGPRLVFGLSTVTREGFFNPLTMDGTIIASGVVTSTYSALPSSSGWVKACGGNTINFQHVFNTLLEPYKLICTAITIDLCETREERLMISDLAFKMYHFFQNNGQSQILAFIAIFLTVVINIISSTAVPAWTVAIIMEVFFKI